MSPDESDGVKILSRQVNGPVMHLLSRRFPGVLMQGDTLHSLYQRVKEAEAFLRSCGFDSEEAETVLDDLQHAAAVLEGCLQHYEAVMKENGLKLPYFRGDERGGPGA